MRAATVVLLCNSCASLAGLVLCFIACFILLVIAPLAILFQSLGKMLPARQQKQEEQQQLKSIN